MIDISKDSTLYILKKLSRVYLSAKSYFSLLVYILSCHRFSVSFCRRLNKLIEEYSAKDTITPSLSGNEDKERRLNEVPV